MRRKLKAKPKIVPDSLYDSDKVSKFINYTMQAGKKTTARKVVYDSFEVMKEQAKVPDPLEVSEAALKNTGPTVAMAEKLAEEIIAASNNEGDAVRKRENTHKMAEANKAFAHFAW